MRVKTPNDGQIIRYLSGGNQQKVVLGKWLSMKPKLLFLDEPTRGIDIGAKREIYTLMEELAERGVVILLFPAKWRRCLVWPIVPLLCMKDVLPANLVVKNFLKKPSCNLPLTLLQLKFELKQYTAK